MNDELAQDWVEEDEPHARFGGCLLVLVVAAVGALAVVIYDIEIPYAEELMERFAFQEAVSPASVTDVVDGSDDDEESAVAQSAERVVEEAPAEPGLPEYDGPRSVYREEGFDPDHVEFDFQSAQGSSSGPRFLSSTQIQRVIDGHQGELLSCYGDELKTYPELSGEVDVEFAIAPDGRVSMVKVTNSTLRSHEAEDCFVEHARQWRFPETNQELHTQFETDFAFSF